MLRRRVRPRTPQGLQRFGDAAVWFPTRSTPEAAGLATAIRSTRIGGVTDVVGGAQSVLVIYEPTTVEFGGLCEMLGSISATQAGPERPVGHVFTVVFDGPDLEEVGALSGLGVEGVRRALLGTTLRVSFLGFAPGFAYLSGLPPALRRVPRRNTPRSSVPAGSLAIGGGHAAVYPRATPGGWHLVGRTDADLFDPDRMPPALLAPGDIVRLREVGPSDLHPRRERRPTTSTQSGVGTFAVEAPGVLTTFQDLGRPGFAHLGVPRSGAADPVSFRLANALVGNPLGAACLETTAAGPTLFCRASTHVAVVGDGTGVSLDGRPVGCGRVLPVDSGQRLRIESTGGTLRAYLAVRGGFEVPGVLGSRSTDRLGGLGPQPIVTGDELVIGHRTGVMSDHLISGAPGQDRLAGPRRLRALVCGPDGDAGWQSGLFGRPFVVGEASDRIGIRLQPGSDSPGLVAGAEIPSSGTTIGTVQVPPGGTPLVLLADHATVGGYRVGAVVISADLSELGRCRPGDEVELVAVDHEEAASALRALERALDGATSGAYPIGAG
jgi:KipI family sensor histidine kinase inhibitor